MNVINTDGLAFLGPGSEWFWSMAQFVVVAVTLLGIYNQLRIARNANAFAQMNEFQDELNAERMSRNELEILLALRDGATPPHGAASFVTNFWESVASLVRAGHVDRFLVHEFLSNSCQWWWAALAPDTVRYRVEAGDPKGGEHFEWLAGVMAEMDAKEGIGRAFDEEHIASTLEKRIQWEQGRLHVAEDLRAVIVRRRSDFATSPRPSSGEVTNAPREGIARPSS